MTPAMSAVPAETPPPSIDRPRLIVVLGLLSALGPLSIDAYLPSLPSIEADFGSGPGSAEVTLSTYFLGLSAAQLLWGRAADRLGRKTPLALGLLLYVVGSIGSALAPSMSMLALARFVQGTGGAASAVIVRAIVRDLWTGREAAKVMSLMMLVMGAAPILAPIAGGLILEVSGWRTIFEVLVIAGFLALVLALRMIPETRSGAAREPLDVTFRALARDRRFLSFTLTASAAQAGMFAYIAGSPSVFIRTLGLDPSQFAIIFGINASGLIALSQLNRRAVTAREPAEVCLYGTSTMALMAFALLVLGAGVLGSAVSPRVSTVMPPLFAFVACLGFVLANSVASALEAHAPRAGVASAVIGTAQFATSALTSFVVGATNDGTLMPMAATMTVTAVVATVAGYFGGRAPKDPTGELALARR